MIINIRLKNFFSIAEEAVIDFTANPRAKKAHKEDPGNLLDFNGDKFVNIIGLFGGNATGKSNLIKAIEFCLSAIISPYPIGEGGEIGYQPFKFLPDHPSEFAIDFVCQGIEYEYSFSIFENKVLSESLYYFPKKRRAKIFERNGRRYSYGKGLVQRPGEIELNTADRYLFLRIGSMMNRPVLQQVFKFFRDNIIIGKFDEHFSRATREEIEANKSMLLKALEISDSDIIDLQLREDSPGKFNLLTFHKENPPIAFDFEKEESEGTKRLFSMLLMLLKAIDGDTTIFYDEFDLKLHLKLAEFILDVVRYSRQSQFVFTSHNSGLLNRALLRDEQMVFVTKLPGGMSEFVALAEYKDTDKIKDLQAAYLQGRFDGVPYIGNARTIVEGK